MPHKAKLESSFLVLFVFFYKCFGPSRDTKTSVSSESIHIYNWNLVLSELANSDFRDFHFSEIGQKQSEISIANETNENTPNKFSFGAEKVKKNNKLNMTKTPRQENRYGTTKTFDQPQPQQE
jgi:hypothetical protein